MPHCRFFLYTCSTMWPAAATTKQLCSMNQQRPFTATPFLAILQHADTDYQQLSANQQPQSSLPLAHKSRKKRLPCISLGCYSRTRTQFVLRCTQSTQQRQRCHLTNTSPQWRPCNLFQQGNSRHVSAACVHAHNSTACACSTRLSDASSLHTTV